MFVQIHSFGEMEEGMIADFTLWLGPDSVALAS